LGEGGQAVEDGVDVTHGRAEVENSVEIDPTGEVRVASISGRQAMTVPGDDGWYRIERGRFVTSRKHFGSRAAAESGGGFAPLLPAAD